jgi:hypothetical protein
MVGIKKGAGLYRPKAALTTLLQPMGQSGQALHHHLEEQAMSRGRKSLKPVEVTDPALDQDRIETAALVMRADALDQQQDATQGVFSLGRAVGAALMANMVKNFSAAAEVRAFEEINKSKSFKRLAIKMPDGILRPAENIDEFCRVVFGRGYKAMNNQKILLEQLGEETYESANRLGLNRGQLRLLVSLPEEDRSIVEEALMSDNKPAVVAAIEALASKLDEAHAKVEELKAEDKAKDALLAEKNRLLDIERAKTLRVQSMPADEVQAELLKIATTRALESMGMLQGSLRMAFVELRDHEQISGGDSTLILAGHVDQLQKLLYALRDEFMLPDNIGDGEPEWMKDTANDADLLKAAPHEGDDPPDPSAATLLN